MKKLMVLLSTFLLVFGIAGVSNATLYQDFFDPPNSYSQYDGTRLFNGESIGWWFDITDDGFDPYTEEIGSAEVELTITNYVNTGGETAILTVGVDWLWWQYENEFTIDLYCGTDAYVGTLSILEGLQDDGRIWATLTAGSASGFFFNDATLYADTIPEPATMLLLGTGIVGLAGMGRKKLFRK